MPNPGTSDAEGYISNIISQGHFSVLEHASATFYLEEVSRNLTHELVRHRHLSYSELSQRFVDMGDSTWVVPPALRQELPVIPLYKFLDGQSSENHPLDLYNDVVTHLLAFGKTRKQAREAARYYLPSGMETKMVVTGNMRAWRDVLHKRYSVHADAEIREFATLVLAELRKIAPASFQDFPEVPFD
jgi:thymidylate synthase (FAD)